ncbi:formaldehyde activating enzyme [Actinomycetospora succinea]|uniref:Formaldehyde activating enzyme n=1 Tax=Actinomycetospora succinea TaxID=663603 RepID=A0A4R6VRB3_9PSEU|nr:formaldehyde-activating enzyme [Actinomycetospora succinea]TDQ65107.1 formaldehyde activating enzyme [Actinomycetospora succinea]
MPGLDGRISQGWGGAPPDGVHVNVVLAERGSATAAALTTTFAAPSAGFAPILISLGPDQPSYETLLPPTLMLNKIPADTPQLESLVFGACQVGIARGVLDAVAADLVAADQETLVFVSLWIDADASDEDAVCRAAREATGRAVAEAARGRAPEDARRLVEQRDTVTHPAYGGSA